MTAMRFTADHPTVSAFPVAVSARPRALGSRWLTSAVVPATTLARPEGAEADVAVGLRRPPVRLVEHAVVSVFTLVMAWPFLRPGRVVAGFDTVAYSGPNLRLTLDTW